MKISFIPSRSLLKYFLAILFSFTAKSLFGQTETTIYKTISTQFEKEYNNGSYNKIFDSFSDEMRDALPLEQVISFLSQLKNQAGRIVQREFIGYESTYGLYKTKFEKAVFILKISIDSLKINGLFLSPYTPTSSSKIERNSTELMLPFNGSWHIAWGGDTEELNYHVVNLAEKNGFDIVVRDSSGKSYKTDGKSNEDYYAFGRKIIAPCDGQIILSIDGIKENTPGSKNFLFIPGNSVILKTLNNEYLLFAHLKQNSILVKQGQMVKRGALLGRCGNSGNSSEPHLHFHVQNTEDISVATGIKCFFVKIFVNGQLKYDYSPIKGEMVRNVFN